MKRHPATQRNATPFFSNEGSVICPAALRDGHAESVDSGECAVTLSSERLVVARAASGCHLIAVLPMMTVSGTLLELLAAHGRSLKAADRSSRDLNARSELSAQLARFETIVRALQQSDSADGDSSAAIAELDLCGALTRMTFSPYTEPLSDDDGTLQTMRRALKRDESADIFLGASPPSALPELDLDEADLDVLVSLLPDAADAKRLTRWYSSESYYHQNALWMDENIVYSPLDFPVLQEQLNSRRNLEADVTAECHAFCAVVTVVRTLVTAVFCAKCLPVERSIFKCRQRRLGNGARAIVCATGCSATRGGRNSRTSVGGSPRPPDPTNLASSLLPRSVHRHPSSASLADDHSDSSAPYGPQPITSPEAWHSVRPASPWRWTLAGQAPHSSELKPSLRPPRAARRAGGTKPGRAPRATRRHLGARPHAAHDAVFHRSHTSSRSRATRRTDARLFRGRRSPAALADSGTPDAS